MTVAPAAADARAMPRRRTRGRAFGIEVDAQLPLPLQETGLGNSSRLTELRSVHARELDDAWRPARPTTVLERRFADGRLVMSVEHDDDAGYRVYAPRNGRHLVSADGRSILSSLTRISPWRWQRLLLAQVLPLAATLHGLELLHASAVVQAGRAVGFVAPAGTGKTSVAAHSVALGAALLTDDVLALEVSGGGVVAHPGANALNLDEGELHTMLPSERRLLGAVVGGQSKVVLAPSVAEHPAPLASIYFLRRPANGELAVSPFDFDPVRLLANSFNRYVRTPARIVNQLDVFAALAESVALFEIAVPAGCPARKVAGFVADHAWAEA